MWIISRVNFFFYIFSFVYGKNITFSDAKDARDLYRAADFYLIESAKVTAQRYILRTLTITNVNDVYEFSLKLNDKLIIQRCREIICTAIYDTTKTENFFDNTEQLQTSERTPFETINVAQDLDKNIENCMEVIKNEKNLFKQTNEYLGLIRLLTSKANSIFTLIIPENHAKLKCSLLWVPPQRTFHELQCYAAMSNIMCNRCHRIPREFICCGREYGSVVTETEDISNFFYEDIRLLHNAIFNRS